MSDGSHPEQAFCGTCGSAWFRASVSLQHDGQLNGLAGPYECLDCGWEYPLGWAGSINPDGSFCDPGEEQS